MFLLLPILYVVVGWIGVLFSTGAGHGNGEAFRVVMSLGFPATLIEKVVPDFYWIIGAGAFQWFLTGAMIDLWFWRKKVKKMAQRIGATVQRLRDRLPKG